MRFLVGDSNICDPAEDRVNSRTQTFSNDTSRAAALPATVPRAVEIAQTYFTRADMRRDGSIPCRASTAFLLTYRWLSYVISSAIPIRLEPLATSRSPTTTSRLGPVQMRFEPAELAVKNRNSLSMLFSDSDDVPIFDPDDAARWHRQEHAMTAVPRTGWRDGVLC